jgi:Ca2+-binding RTX toxin-like protein
MYPAVSPDGAKVAFASFGGGPDGARIAFSSFPVLRGSKDSLDGGGDDYLLGGKGRDTLRGAAGDDTLRRRDAPQLRVPTDLHRLGGR